MVSLHYTLYTEMLNQGVISLWLNDVLDYIT